MSLCATPFHARAVEANRWNAWENRGGFTLAAAYGNAEEEALAARFGAVLADISWHWRVRISGAQAGDFVSRLLTRNAAALDTGGALAALWLNDGGAVRGDGTIIRLGRDEFLLTSVQEDFEWLQAAAHLFAVEVTELTQSDGVLALIGPASQKILVAAGLDAGLAPLTYRKQTWRGVEIALSTLGLGFEIWCHPDDALTVWDRIVAAGSGYALMPAGQTALDLLEFESGLLRPGRDYTPTRDGFAPHPAPQELGLCALVDRAHMFNGRAGFLAAGPETTLCGVLLEDENPVTNATLSHQGRVVGCTLNARFLPVLQRAAAFAILNGPWPASELMAGGVPCRPLALPFLPVPTATGATENPRTSVK